MIEKTAIKELATLIDNAINAQGLTTKKLAEDLGVSTETVRRWRKGENLASRVGIEAITVKLGIERDLALRLHAQAKAESGEGSSLSGLVAIPATLQSHIDELENRLSTLEEKVRNHLKNH